MKKLIIFFFLIQPAFANCVVTDDSGNHLQLAKPAAKIISLAPDITEDLFAIGAGGKIIGTVTGSDYPEQAKQIPIIGSYTGLDLEKIVLMHPDLIVAWNSAFTRQTLALRRMNIPIYVINPVHLEDIPKTLRNLGCLTGNNSKAQVAAEQFTQALNNIRLQYSATPIQKVFYQIGSYSLMTINKDSWINQAIEICHGKNIFADANIITPEVSWEAVIDANPDVIISDAQQPDWKARWQKWQMITAIKQGRLYSVNPDLIDRAGPRLLQGINKICTFLRPI